MLVQEIAMNRTIITLYYNESEQTKHRNISAPRFSPTFRWPLRLFFEIFELSNTARHLIANYFFGSRLNFQLAVFHNYSVRPVIVWLEN